MGFQSHENGILYTFGHIIVQLVDRYKKVEQVCSIVGPLGIHRLI